VVRDGQRAKAGQTINVTTTRGVGAFNQHFHRCGNRAAARTACRILLSNIGCVLE